MVSWMIRQIRRHPVRSSFLAIVAGAIGFYWVAPLIAASYFVPAVGLCTLGGLLVSGVVNWFTNRYSFLSRGAPSELPAVDKEKEERKDIREQKRVVLAERKRVTHSDEKELKRSPIQERDFLKRKNWIIFKLRSNQLAKDVQNNLIANLENFSRSLDLRVVNGEEELHDWMRRNLSQGQQHEILKIILQEWLELTENDAVRIFSRHTKKDKPLGTAACFKLLNSDFKNILLKIEGFLSPVVTETAFNREIKWYGSGVGKDAAVCFAREGKLSYVEYALNKLATQEVQKLLPQAIKEAAENGYLEVVKYLIDRQEKEEDIPECLFKIALQANNTKMFSWLINTYDDAQLKSKNHEGLDITMQIRFFNSGHNNSIPTNAHPLVMIYNTIRKIDAVSFSGGEGEFKRSVVVSSRSS